MSRVSLARRIARIKEHLLPPGSLEYALEQLSDDHREQWLNWRAKADAINRQTERWAENVYAALLDDPLLSPPMPRTLSYALFPYLRDVDREPDPVRAYQIMLSEGVE